MLILVFQNVDKTTEVSSGHHSSQKRWGQPLVVHVRLFAKICSWWDSFRSERTHLVSSNQMASPGNSDRLCKDAKVPVQSMGENEMTQKGNLACLRGVIPLLCFSWWPPFLHGVVRPSHTEWVPMWTSHHRNGGAQGKSKYEPKWVLYSNHSGFRVTNSLFKADTW